MDRGVRVHDIPVVILAGGQGTRLREETVFRPKPMVEIGGRPILWHIMKYDHSGFRRFVLPVGYLGDSIKTYFLSYADHQADFTVDTEFRVTRSTMTPARRIGASPSSIRAWIR